MGIFSHHPLTPALDSFSKLVHLAYILMLTHHALTLVYRRRRDLEISAVKGDEVSLDLDLDHPRSYNTTAQSK